MADADLGDEPAEPSAGDPGPAGDDPAVRAYWRTHLALLALLLSIWALVSYGCGIVFAEQLNETRLPGTGFKLGFWFAQQGSIYVFVLLIYVYVRLMNRLDREFDVAEDE